MGSTQQKTKHCNATNNSCDANTQKLQCKHTTNCNAPYIIRICCEKSVALQPIQIAMQHFMGLQNPIYENPHFDGSDNFVFI